MSLTVRKGADTYNHASARIHTNVSRIGGGVIDTYRRPVASSKGGHLYVSRNADTKVFVLCAGLKLPFAESVVVNHLDSFPQSIGRAAGIVVETCSSDVRKFFGTNKIAVPDNEWMQL